MTLRAKLNVVVAAMLLSACEVPVKVGDLPGTDSGASSDDVATADPTDGATGPGGTTGPGETADPTGAETGSGEASVSSSGPTSGDTDGGTSECAALAEAECAAEPECAPRYGVALEFQGCPEGQVFLGCSAARGCDEAVTTVCRDGTREAYKLWGDCVPEGFSACDNLLSVCGTPCIGLDQADCEATVVCRADFGNPHVPDGRGGECVDDQTALYLACDLDLGACPPFVPTVCPMGQPGVHFDVPSGCFPPGFLSCPAGAGTPACP